MFTLHINLSWPKAYQRTDHPIHAAEYDKEELLSLHPRTFFFRVSSTVISFRDIRQDCTHFFCMIMNSSWARSSSSGKVHPKCLEF
jgi:hypothetical protein